MTPAVKASRTPEAQRPEVSLPVGLRRHAPCESPPSWNAWVNGPLHGQPVALAVAPRGRHADMVLAGPQARITSLVPTERRGRNASWRGEPTLTPAFTSPFVARSGPASRAGFAAVGSEDLSARETGTAVVA